MGYGEMLVPGVLFALRGNTLTRTHVAAMVPAATASASATVARRRVARRRVALRSTCSTTPSASPGGESRRISTRSLSSTFAIAGSLLRLRVPFAKNRRHRPPRPMQEALHRALGGTHDLRHLHHVEIEVVPEHRGLPLAPGEAANGSFQVHQLGVLGLHEFAEHPLVNLVHGLAPLVSVRAPVRRTKGRPGCIGSPTIGDAASRPRARGPYRTSRALGLKPSPSSRPQLTMRFGRRRMNSGAKLGKRGLIDSPPVWWSSASPRTSMAWACLGGPATTSSTRKVTFRLRWASRHFLLDPKPTPPMSMASWSSLNTYVSGTMWG